MHRNQLRRWLTRHNVDPKTFGSGAEVEEESTSDGRETKN